MYATADPRASSYHLMPINLPRGKDNYKQFEIRQYPKVYVKNPNCLKVIRFIYDPQGTVRTFIKDKLQEYGDAVYCTILNLPKYLLRQGIIEAGALGVNLLCQIYAPLAAPMFMGAFAAFEIWSTLVGVARSILEVYIASMIYLGDRNTFAGQAGALAALKRRLARFDLMQPIELKIFTDTIRRVSLSISKTSVKMLSFVAMMDKTKRIFPRTVVNATDREYPCELEDENIIRDEPGSVDNSIDEQPPVIKPIEDAGPGEERQKETIPESGESQPRKPWYKRAASSVKRAVDIRRLWRRDD